MASLRQSNPRAYDAIYRQTIKGGYPAAVIRRVRALGYDVSDSYARRVVNRVRETSRVATVTPFQRRPRRLPTPIAVPRGLEGQPPRYRRRFQYFSLVTIYCDDASPPVVLIPDQPVQFGSERRLTSAEVSERSKSIAMRGLTTSVQGQGTERYETITGCSDVRVGDPERIEIFDSGQTRSQAPSG